MLFHYGKGQLLPSWSSILLSFSIPSIKRILPEQGPSDRVFGIIRLCCQVFFICLHSRSVALVTCKGKKPRRITISLFETFDWGFQVYLIIFIEAWKQMIGENTKFHVLNGKDGLWGNRCRDLGPNRVLVLVTGEQDSTVWLISFMNLPLFCLKAILCGKPMLVAGLVYIIGLEIVGGNLRYTFPPTIGWLKEEKFWRRGARLQGYEACYCLMQVKWLLLMEGCSCLAPTIDHQRRYWDSG